MKFAKILMTVSLLSFGSLSSVFASDLEENFFIVGVSNNICQTLETRLQAESQAKHNAEYFAYERCSSEGKNVRRIGEFEIMGAYCHSIARAEYTCN